MPANYATLITPLHLRNAAALMPAWRRKRRTPKAEWLVDVNGSKYAANKLFQRAAGIAGLSLPPKSTHQIANFLISKGFVVYYNGWTVRSASDAKSIQGAHLGYGNFVSWWGGGTPPNTAPPPNYAPPPPSNPSQARYSTPRQPPPQSPPMKVAPPPPTRKATLESALAQLEEALMAKAAESGITPDMRKSFDRYQELKRNYLMRVTHGFKSPEEKNEAETVLRTALVTLVKITV